MVEQMSTCSPWKRPHTGAGGYLKKAVTAWGPPCWSRLLPGPADLWREEPKPVALKGASESDKWQKESPPVESQVSEQTPLRSELSLRGESR